MVLMRAERTASNSTKEKREEKDSRRLGTLSSDEGRGSSPFGDPPFFLGEKEFRLCPLRGGGMLSL